MKFKFIATNRAVIKIAGPDGVSLLQGLVTNDVHKIGDHAAAARCLYTALLTPHGRYLFDFFIYPHDDDLLIDIDVKQAADFIKKMQIYKLRAQVQITDVSASYQVVLSEKPVEHSFPDPRLPQLGYRSILPRTNFTSNGEDYYESLRITHAVPALDKELIPEKSIILECGLDELHALDWEKGCYVGQELMARTKHRGGINKRLFPVAFTGHAPEFMSPILAGDNQEVGTLRSTSGQRGIAMLRIAALQELREDGELTCQGRTLKIRTKLPLPLEESM